MNFPQSQSEGREGKSQWSEPAFTETSSSPLVYHGLSDPSLCVELRMSLPKNERLTDSLLWATDPSQAYIWAPLFPDAPCRFYFCLSLVFAPAFLSSSALLCHDNGPTSTFNCCDLTRNHHFGGFFPLKLQLLESCNSWEHLNPFKRNRRCDFRLH